MAPIRIATLQDLPRIVEIYNQAIASRNATADINLLTVNQRLDWFYVHDPWQHPIYIHEDEEGLVGGWLSVSVYRPRPALLRTAEISYYVDYSHHGQGVGSALMAHAIQNAPSLGKKVYLAILLEWNMASLHLLEKFGFERWGYLPDVVELDGRLCGHLYYGRKV